jgi:hypothetical protein
VGCTTINERVMYRQAIDSFAPRVLKSDGTRIWITQDMRNSIDTGLAEEVFINYIVEKNLAAVIEKHPDDLMGLKENKDAGAGGANAKDAVKVENEIAVAAGLFGGGGGGGMLGGGPRLTYDNNLSNDTWLEKEKKRGAAKILIWRVDELTGKKCVVHFRLSDAATGVVEYSDTVTVEVEGRSSEGGGRAASGGSSPAPRRRDD